MFSTELFVADQTAKSFEPGKETDSDDDDDDDRGSGKENQGGVR